MPGAATRRRFGLMCADLQNLVYDTAEGLPGRRSVLRRLFLLGRDDDSNGPVCLRVRVTARDVSHNTRTFTRTVRLRR